MCLTVMRVYIWGLEEGGVKRDRGITGRVCYQRGYSAYFIFYKFMTCFEGCVKLVEPAQASCWDTERNLNQEHPLEYSGFNWLLLLLPYKIKKFTFSNCAKGQGPGLVLQVLRSKVTILCRFQKIQLGRAFLCPCFLEALHLMLWYLTHSTIWVG